MTSQFLEQARATAQSNQNNIELQGEVESLKAKLAEETAERERIIEEKCRSFKKMRTRRGKH